MPSTSQVSSERAMETYFTGEIGKTGRAPSNFIYNEAIKKVEITVAAGRDKFRIRQAIGD